MEELQCVEGFPGSVGVEARKHDPRCTEIFRNERNHIAGLKKWLQYIKEFSSEKKELEDEHLKIRNLLDLKEEECRNQIETITNLKLANKVLETKLDSCQVEIKRKTNELDESKLAQETLAALNERYKLLLEQKISKSDLGYIKLNSCHTCSSSTKCKSKNPGRIRKLPKNLKKKKKKKISKGDPNSNNEPLKLKVRKKDDRNICKTNTVIKPACSTNSKLIAKKGKSLGLPNTVTILKERINVLQHQLESYKNIIDLEDSKKSETSSWNTKAKVDPLKAAKAYLDSSDKVEEYLNRGETPVTTQWVEEPVDKLHACLFSLKSRHRSVVDEVLNLRQQVIRLSSQNRELMWKVGHQENSRLYEDLLETIVCLKFQCSDLKQLHRFNRKLEKVHYACGKSYVQKLSPKGITRRKRTKLRTVCIFIVVALRWKKLISTRREYQQNLAKAIRDECKLHPKKANERPLNKRLLELTFNGEDRTSLVRILLSNLSLSGSNKSKTKPSPKNRHTKMHENSINFANANADIAFERKFPD